MNFGRIFRHLLMPHWMVTRAFPRSTLNSVEKAVRASEHQHDGELRFAVEGALHPLPLLRGQTVRARALEVFSDLRVWDTEHNSGVLIYVQFADRRIEIVADRGISARVEQAEWDAICRGMEARFRQSRHEAAALEAIEAITRLLTRHFPGRRDKPDELPDRPVVL